MAQGGGAQLGLSPDGIHTVALHYTHCDGNSVRNEMEPLTFKCCLFSLGNKLPKVSMTVQFVCLRN